MAKITFKAGGDLTDKIGFAVKADTDNKEVVLGGANEVCLGILINDNAYGKPVAVALTGEVVKIKCGSAVEFGNPLIAEAGGALIPAVGTGDDNVIAIALEDGADNDLIYAEVVKYVK